jgi:hypothetical protein
MWLGEFRCYEANVDQVMMVGHEELLPDNVTQELWEEVEIESIEDVSLMSFAVRWVWVDTVDAVAVRLVCVDLVEKVVGV